MKLSVKFWMLWLVLYYGDMHKAPDPHTWNLPRVTGS
jgi:hypothetical protein